MARCTHAVRGLQQVQQGGAVVEAPYRVPVWSRVWHRQLQPGGLKQPTSTSLNTAVLLLLLLLELTCRVLFRQTLNQHSTSSMEDG